MNLKKDIRRILNEETESKKVNLVKKMIYTLYDNVSFIEQSTFNNKPLLKVYFDSDEPAANIESWLDNQISKDVDRWTGGIVVCPYWVPDWDGRKNKAHIYIDSRLLKYDELGNVIDESIITEESSRDLSPIIERMLDLMVVKPNKDIVCKIKVKHPDNRFEFKYQEEPFERYRVDITFIGGVDSEYWPRTQDVIRMYDDVADTVWDLIYEYMGKSVDIYHDYKTKCD